jgi:hypothetical protein
LLDLITYGWTRFLEGCPPGEPTLIEKLRNLDLLENTTENMAEEVIEWLKVHLASD